MGAKNENDRAVIGLLSAVINAESVSRDCMQSQISESDLESGSSSKKYDMTMTMTAPRSRIFSLRALVVLMLVLVVSVQGVPADQHEECEAWALQGECDENAGFMRTACAVSCDRADKAAAALDKELSGIESFFELSGLDIDGNTVKFDQFAGQVTILVNVASYCGYTASHYKGLVELWSHVQSENVQILAFPCNQFGKQEPGTAKDIKDFAASQGVKFRIMQKIDVNGPDANVVYKYLKRQAGPGSIQWNFATYFVVGPDGDVQSHSGVEPMQLKDLALNLLKEEL